MINPPLLDHCAARLGKYSIRSLAPEKKVNRRNGFLQIQFDEDDAHHDISHDENAILKLKLGTLHWLTFDMLVEFQVCCQ